MPAALVSAPAVATADTSVHASQSVEVDASALSAPVNGEAYAATSGKELRAAANMRTADTFVNDLSSPVQWPFPVGVPISDDFGPRAAPCSGCSTQHKGLDMTPGEGTPISVIADGVVLETQESDSGLGVSARIEHIVDGERYVSVYAHMGFGSLQIQPGQVVRVGDQVGEVGNSGQSTGPHLHLEIWRNGTEAIDPYAWLSEQVGR